MYIWHSADQTYFQKGPFISFRWEFCLNFPIHVYTDEILWRQSFQWTNMIWRILAKDHQIKYSIIYSAKLLLFYSGIPYHMYVILNS